MLDNFYKDFDQTRQNELYFAGNWRLEIHICCNGSNIFTFVHERLYIRNSDNYFTCSNHLRYNETAWWQKLILIVCCCHQLLNHLGFSSFFLHSDNFIAAANYFIGGSPISFFFIFFWTRKYSDLIKTYKVDKCNKKKGRKFILMITSLPLLLLVQLCAVSTIPATGRLGISNKSRHFLPNSIILKSNFIAVKSLVIFLVNWYTVMKNSRKPNSIRRKKKTKNAYQR